MQPHAGAAQTISTQHHYDANGNSTHTTTQGWDGQAVVTRPSSRIEYEASGCRKTRRFALVPSRIEYEASGRYVARSYQTYPNHGEVLASQVLTRNAYGSATVAADTLGNRAYTYKNISYKGHP